MKKSIFILTVSVFAFKAWSQSGQISTIAGNGTASFGGDGSSALSAQLNGPNDASFDAVGNMYIGDGNNNRIRKVDHSTGNISTIAGTGSSTFSGDGGQATAAGINQPSVVLIDGSGNLLLVDQFNNRIREINLSSGIITTVAGNGMQGYNGDGGQATASELNGPVSLALDNSGNILIGDARNNVLRKVNTGTGVITTIAGNGTGAFSGDGGQATLAELYFPIGISVDAAGNIFFADGYNDRIRRIDGTSGVITTVAGNGTLGYYGDGGQATATEFMGASDVKLDAMGNMYIADNGGNRVREVMNNTGIINTIAGNGVGSFSGDGGPATAAEIYAPTLLTIDASGDLIISDQKNNRIRKVNSVTGINAITDYTNLTIYPNPNYGQFTISGLEKGMTIEVYDYTGRKISEVEAKTETMQLNISNQSNGVYLIRIIDKDGNLVSNKKVMKSK